MQAGGAEGGGGEGAGGLGGDNAAVVLRARPAFISKTSTTTSPVAEEAAALTQLSTLRVASRHTCGGIRTFEHICVDHVGVGLLIQGWVSYRLWSTVWDRTGGAEVQSAQSEAAQALFLGVGRGMAAGGCQGGGAGRGVGGSGAMGRSAFARPNLARLRDILQNMVF